MGTQFDVVRAAAAVDALGGLYVWGAKGPKNFDCSGFTREAARRAGGTLVHGAQNQRDQLRRAGRLVSVTDAMKTPGAVLFRIDERPSNDHVAVSVGNGSTYEAHSSKYGIGLFSAQGRRWTHGGLIPGVSYGGGAPPPVKPVPPVSSGEPVDWVALAALVANCKAQTVLRNGSSGLCVLFAQVGINRVSGRGLKEDGKFGPATRSAVIDLQRWLGLTVDGVIGPQVWRVLYP